MTKNEDYWGDEPQLDRAVLKTISDVDTLTIAFQNGEVDIVVPIPDESVPLFESKPNVVIDSRTSARVQMFRFNMDSPLIQDVNLRNTDHAEERYDEVLAHVLGKKPKTQYYTEANGKIIKDTISLKGNDWNFNQHQIIDTIPTDEDFKKVVSSYLSWKVSQLMKENI